MQNAHFVPRKEFKMLAIRQTFLSVDGIAIHDIAKIKTEYDLNTCSSRRPQIKSV